jgi:predicted nucleic acid-binding protein
MANWRLQYWDAPVFISFITAQDEERVRVIRSLLLAHERGEFQIVISAFVVAEVRSVRPKDSPGPKPGAEGTEKVYPMVPEHMAQVRELFESDRLIYYTLTDSVARDAAKIGNDFPSLLPGDCVHIATADRAKADVLFTYDGFGQRRRPDQMMRYSERIGDPPLKIIEPVDLWPTLGLPNERAVPNLGLASAPPPPSGQSLAAAQD